LGKPAVSAELSEEERALHEVVMRSLPKGLLTLADTGLVERYAVAWARFRQSQRMLKKQGLVVKGWRGTSTRNPYLTIEHLAAEEMHRCGEVIGLSPVARTRLASSVQPEEDPLTLLLDGRKDGAYFVPAKGKAGG